MENLEKKLEKDSKERKFKKLQNILFHSIYILPIVGAFTTRLFYPEIEYSIAYTSIKDIPLPSQK